MNWIPILLQLLRTVGTVLGSILMQLLTGRFLKRLVVLPLRKVAEWTSTPEDDKLVHDAEEDLGLEHEEKKEPTSGNG